VTNGGIHSTHHVTMRTNSCVCYTHNIALRRVTQPLGLVWKQTLICPE